MSGVLYAVKRGARQILFGPGDFPQQVPVGMRDPQPEVTVRLCGAGMVMDVTQQHFMACATPFLVGAGMTADQARMFAESRHPIELRFEERTGAQRPLGEIRLEFFLSIAAGHRRVCLFRATGSRNHCLPAPWLWARYLRYARIRQQAKDADVPITASEVHAMIAFYICPRPVALVTACDGQRINVFPMNLMGAAGGDLFCFALNKSREAGTLVERAGRLALSNIPAEKIPSALGLGRNHRKTGIALSELPFATRPSRELGLPVADFAVRVRELEVESVRAVGSHRLFVARVLGDERKSDAPQFFVVHGIYQSWRQRMKYA